MYSIYSSYVYSHIVYIYIYILIYSMFTIYMYVYAWNLSKLKVHLSKTSGTFFN